MTRALIVLGTASQVPTRERNHNGYVLRWDGSSTLFDPGEGTQRQMALAGVTASSITRICITHFHGDHCLGLPGVLQRMSLDRVAHPVAVAFPSSGSEYFERLRHASAYDDRLDVAPYAVHPPSSSKVTPVLSDPASSTMLSTAPLRHTVESVGWRIDEHPGRTMLPDRLHEAGVVGATIGRLQREGAITVGGARVTIEQVSVERPAQSVAFVMDTSWCDGALAIADGADLLVCEATFAEADADRASEWGHLTAGQAGRLAREAAVRRLVITHFSRRYPDVRPLVDEAAAEFDGDVVAAADLLTVAVPARLR
jgi:ribonuclease Z